MNSSLLMQRFFYHGGSFIIRALAKKQCKSNSDVDPEHVCHEHTWQQVLKKNLLLPGPLNGSTDLTYGGLSLGDNSDNNATINSFL